MWTSFPANEQAMPLCLVTKYSKPFEECISENIAFLGFEYCYTCLYIDVIWKKNDILKVAIPNIILLGYCLPFP